MDASSRKIPDCMNCWKHETCQRAEAGRFCPAWQDHEPKPKGPDPNDLWRRGEDAPV